MNRHIRPARPEDAPAIHGLIRELAEYERLLHEVDATPDMIAAALFGPERKVFAEVAELHGEIVGFALWFYSFSTFRGRHGIYLEDLYVQPGHRGRGLGKALLGALARRCVAENLPRLEWSVLDWNEPAISFYKEQGTTLMDGWTTCRVTDAALWRLADQAL